jgi:hypothetical protein
LGISVDEILLHEESGRLLHFEIQIQNTSDVILKSNHAELRLRQVVPLPAHLAGCVQKDTDPVYEGKTEVEWPSISNRTWRFEKEGTTATDSLTAAATAPNSSGNRKTALKNK